MIENFGYDSPKGLSLVLEKHGTHDQSSHGSWAGLSAGVAGKVMQLTREWGGLSINMKDGSLPNSGYMVAKPPEFGAIVDEADFFDAVKGPKILADYMKTHREDLGSGKNYLGTWLNEGKVYLDVSENIQDVAEATRVGRERNQKAIWDVVNLAEVDTGGTGLVEKESQHGRVAGHLEDDRRTNRGVREADSRETNTIVIKFAPNLKPALKHASHDQSSHGSWATGGGKWAAYGSRAETIAAHEAKGSPNAQEIREMMQTGDPEDTSDLNDEELVEIIQNDSVLYDEYNENIENILTNGNYQQDEYGGYSDEQINEAATLALQEMRTYSGERINFVRGKEAGVFDEQNVVSRMGELYNYYDPNSEMFAEVDSAYLDGDGLRITGIIYSPDGEGIGEFVRTFEPDGNSVKVSHDIFRISDELYQGRGFGRGFIENQENAYIAAGVTRINLYSAWDGAYTWSRAGYDFDPTAVRNSIAGVTDAFEVADKTDWSPADLAKLSNLQARSTNLNLSDPDFPFPYEFAELPGAKNTLYGVRVDFEKVLTAEGARLREGAIDADGDGMIFDGTRRERPAG